jgi:hypothetical protein
MDEIINLIDLNLQILKVFSDFMVIMIIIIIKATEVIIYHESAH